MWAPSGGLATVAPGGPAPLAGRPARLFVVSSLRPRDTGERQHAGPAGRWLPGRWNGLPRPGGPGHSHAAGMGRPGLADWRAVSGLGCVLSILAVASGCPEGWTASHTPRGALR